MKAGAATGEAQEDDEDDDDDATADVEPDGFEEVGDGRSIGMPSVG